jgi:hypothetical protein
MGIAAWYYEQLAIPYQKRSEADQVVAHLERFAAQPPTLQG